MAKESAASVVVETKTPKSVKTAVVKSKANGSMEKTKAKPIHPKTSEMVTDAIRSLKEKNGSSLQAIKKYIAANYKADPEKLAPLIKKYLKASVTTGLLVQTKGKGASGSFKIAKAVAEKKQVAVKKPKTIAADGQAKVKGKAKESAPKKMTSPKKAAAKAKKTGKAPTEKPKAPKPKKVLKPKSPKNASTKN